ncbi:HAUS augmin-like complex subunit 2 [Chanos chanos]|uniref:HAUS augmin-like complex subunit 2 n=1 Tax=Chanos chanos TaxID=29144 RepID=A0A6J2WKN7_CHACN|nr:HAUS augmin-like complex subunit 2 [Chanos chanos]
MDSLDPIPYSVTPAARVLSRCVNAGVVSQENLDAVPRETSLFSRLLEVEEQGKIKNKIAQKSLDLELLMLEKDCADVTHNYHLSKRFVTLQQSTSHLQEVLRQQTCLRQRLMKPPCQQNLPLQADLHRYVVELMGMVVEFINDLEMKMKTVRSIPLTQEYMSNMNNALVQLVTQVTEVEKLSKQVLEWRGQQSSISTDAST